MSQNSQKPEGGIRLPYAVQILRRSFEPWFGAFLLLEIKGFKPGFKEDWLLSKNQSSLRQIEKALLKLLSSNIYTYRSGFYSHAGSVRDVEPSYVKPPFTYRKYSFSAAFLGGTISLFTLSLSDLLMRPDHLPPALPGPLEQLEKPQTPRIDLLTLHQTATFFNNSASFFHLVSSL
jgi:hypothetical protein